MYIYIDITYAWIESIHGNVLYFHKTATRQEILVFFSSARENVNFELLSFYLAYLAHNLRILHTCPRGECRPIHVVIKIRIITSPLYIRKKSMDANKDKISSQTKKRKEKKIYIVSHYYLYFLIVSQCSLYRTTVISYRGKVITKRISNNLHLPTRL